MAGGVIAGVATPTVASVTPARRRDDLAKRHVNSEAIGVSAPLGSCPVAWCRTGCGRNGVVPATPALMIVGLLTVRRKEAPAMAGADRMTVEEVVRKVLADQHADVIREAVKAVAGELMELEVSALIGAEHGERRPDDRATHRGYRARRSDARGRDRAADPQDPPGSFQSILEPRRRSEQALSVVQQAYVCGASRPRRVDQFGRELGVAHLQVRGQPRLPGARRARGGVEEPRGGSAWYLDAKVEKVREIAPHRPDGQSPLMSATSAMQGASRRVGRELRLEDHDGGLHRAARGEGIEVLVRLSPSAPQALALFALSPPGR